MNAHVKTTSPTTILAGEGSDALLTTETVARPQIAADVRLSQPRLIGTVLLVDALVLAGAGMMSALVIPVPTASVWTIMAVIVAVTLSIILLHQRAWGYTIASLAATGQQAGRLAGAFALTFATVVTLAVLIGIDAAAWKGWWIAYALTGFGLLLLGRVVVARLMRRWTEQGRLARRAVIVGGGKPVTDLIDALAKDGSRAIQILGLFDDRGGERSPEQVETYHKLGKFDELVDFCREHKVDLLILTLPHTAEARILYLLKKLWVLPIDIRISALGAKLKLRPRAYSYIGKVPFLAVFDKPLTDWGIAVKAVEDRVLAGLLLVLLAPVMAAVALAVRLDSRGPIFFRQTRYGFNNDAIGVYKFRSMYVDQCDAQASRLVTRDDPRVTRVGAFIRKTSLDELPQLFNVLRGELSIVGPRPHAMQAKAGGHIYDEVVEGYFARHRVKPGITGWAQINGWRGETDTVDKIERRVECDLHYIDNWSVFFDLYILAMTPVSLVTTKNAY